MRCDTAENGCSIYGKQGGEQTQRPGQRVKLSPPAGEIYFTSCRQGLRENGFSIRPQLTK